MYQHFLFEAANPGIVRTQTVANEPFVKFNLVKTKNTNTVNPLYSHAVGNNATFVENVLLKRL